MSELSCVIGGHSRPFRVGGFPETASTLEVVNATVLTYPDGSQDTLPALTKAIAPGPIITFDRTAAIWLAYSIVGSGVLSVLRFVDRSSLESGGDYTCLCYILPHDVYPYLSGGSGNAAFSWKPVNADYTITPADSGILVDASGGNITITLPTAVGVTQQFTIARKDSNFPSTTVTLTTTSGQTINGVTSGDLVDLGQSFVLGSDGSNWWIASGYYASPLTTLGDTLGTDLYAKPQRQAIGTNGQALRVDTTQPLDLIWS